MLGFLLLIINTFLSDTLTAQQRKVVWWARGYPWCHDRRTSQVKQKGGRRQQCLRGTGRKGWMVLTGRWFITVAPSETLRSLS